jgi:hypothetical protein
MGVTPADWRFEPQMLRQEGDMDCGLSVIGALAKLNREEILHDMPEAVNGKTVDQWKAYLTERGIEVVQYGPKDDHPLPCAHLVAAPGLHWIYQAEDGGIHDPSSVFQHVPPKLINHNFSNYYGEKILTIAIRRRP